MLHLLANAQRADRAGQKNFVAGGFAGLAGDFYAAMDQFGDAIGETYCGELVAIGAEGVGFENLRAGIEIGL